ncbi:MAG: SMC-Scp complex subunit ScpB [Conexivisphaerales archaeon]
MIIDKDMLQAKLEAALYSAGRPLSVDELCKAANTKSRRKVLKAIADIASRINSNFKAIEVAKVGNDSFAIQLRPEFNVVAKKFGSRPILSKSVLKTLTMIAYFQPISAKSLADRRGTSVYNHLKVLESWGLIAGRQEGKNMVYTTTDFFAHYFGLPSDPSQVKEKLKRLFPPAVQQETEKV